MTTITNPTETPTAFPGAQRATKYIEEVEAPPAPTPDAPAADDQERVRVSAAQLLEHVEEPAADTDPSLATDQTDDTDLGTLSITAVPRIARSGLRGAVAKLGIRLAPGAAETAALALGEQLRQYEETVRQATWTRAVSVLVANPKGGVGKTPTSLLLGGMLAAIRGGSVCIMEVSDDPGALTFRSEGRPTRGLGELVRDASLIRSAGQLAGYTAPQTSFAAVIGSVGSRPRLDGDHVAAVARVVDDYFAIRIMDSGNQPSSAAFQAAVDTADALVIPIFNAGDAALEAAALIDTLRNAGGKSAQLAENAIVVRLQDGRPENPQVVARVDRILTGYGIRHIHAIPYDPHIAERGQLTLAKLAAPTHHAFAAAAADVVRTLQNTVR
ncbi:MAG: ParA family protein [Rhodoglobus sp.]